MQKPTGKLLKSAKHVLRYLIGTIELEVVYCVNDSELVKGFRNVGCSGERPARK